MIISEEVEIKIRKNNIEHFESLGYDIKLRDVICIPPEHLTSGTHTKIKVKCNICGTEKELPYKKYLKNIKKYNIYTCSEKCAYDAGKNKKTNLEKHGVEHPMKNKKIFNKGKQTKKEKYDNENYNNREQFLETMDGDWDRVVKASRQTKLKNHGDENYNNRKQAKETCLEKYNVVHPMMLDETKEKNKQTCLANHGVEHPLQNTQIFKKALKSLFDKKDYILPSGNIIKIQGYENLALDILLKLYNENNLLIDDENIENKIGQIWYFDNNIKRRYYPDIYIISENKIIEVKSEYIFKKQKEKNLLKEQRCLDMDIKFEFMIFNNKKKLLTKKLL